MTINEWADDEASKKAAEREERSHAQLRQENARLRTSLRATQEKVLDLEKLVNFGHLADASSPEPPKWLSPPVPKKSHATLMLLLSDMHFDEVVDLAEMDGLNCYDRTIATIRLERWARNVVKLARHYMAGVTYDGVVLMLAGDTFSGNIHDELKESNADLLFGSVLYWMEQLAAAFTLLADEFGKVHIVGTPGNHGRMTRKPRYKGRAKDNVDWLLLKLLERQFKADKRLTWQLPDSFDAHFTVYGQGHLLTHGDQVSGGGGIGGIWPPIMRMRARKQALHMATGKPFESLWMGHWHQYIAGPGLIVNGSMKGYDEYAKGHSFGFERPQQAMAIVTPENGITWQCPVLCDDRAKENW